jgi:hypothetical protein
MLSPSRQQQRPSSGELQLAGFSIKSFIIAWIEALPAASGGGFGNDHRRESLTAFVQPKYTRHVT